MYMVAVIHGLGMVGVYGVGYSIAFTIISVYNMLWCFVT